MLRYTLKRSQTLVLSLLAASVVVFTLVEVLPGDAAAFMLGMEADESVVAELRRQLGLDLPLLQRYFDWIWAWFGGDFGISYTYRTPVSELIGQRLLVSAPLALYALLLALLFSFPLAIIAATHYRSPIDIGIMGVTQIGLALPNFWFAMLLVQLMAVKLGWFAAGGFSSWHDGWLPALKSLTLPALALALPEATIFARVLRASLLDVLSADFVRTARAKGLSFQQAVRRHALVNALIPGLTILALQLSALLAGTIVIENVFFLPGVGRLIFQSLMQRDLIVVESVVLLLVFTVIVINFLMDLVQAMIDPRLRRRH